VSSTQTPQNRSTVVTVVCLAVGVLSVFGALNSYQVSTGYAAQFPDAYGGGVAQLRFAPLNARVPATAELGYFTDIDPTLPAYSAAFLAAQYAVAPRVLLFVDAQTQPEWAAGNFTKPMDFAAAGDAKGYTLTADLGNGVVLFHRK